MAQQAKFPYLCFVHEDVVIHSIAWGEKLVNLLKLEEIGIVGVSGAVYKSSYPSTWSMAPVEYYRTHSIQRWKNGSITENEFKSKPNAEIDEVVVLDGVFLAMRKTVWSAYPFNEWDIKGFHFYDYDICMRVKPKYKLIVSYEILLEHFSEGVLSQEWVCQSFKFHSKYKKELPSYLMLAEPIDTRVLERITLENLLYVLIRLGCQLYFGYYLFLFFFKNPSDVKWIKILYYYCRRLVKISS